MYHFAFGMVFSSPTVALAYALVAAFLFALSRSPAAETVAAPNDVPDGVPAE